jgi:hypothetical protein
MKIAGYSSSGSPKSAFKEGESLAAQTRLELTSAERALLLKACRQYRYSIPSYIQVRQGEIRLLDAIIERLSE